MMVALDGAIPAGPCKPFSVLLKQASAAMASESLQPLMPLWLGLVSGGVNGSQGAIVRP